MVIRRSDMISTKTGDDDDEQSAYLVMQVTINQSKDQIRLNIWDCL